MPTPTPQRVYDTLPKNQFIVGGHANGKRPLCDECVEMANDKHYALVHLLHDMVKHLLVDKDANFEPDNFSEEFQEEGEVMVMNSINDPKPEYYHHILEKTADKILFKLEEIEK